MTCPNPDKNTTYLKKHHQHHDKGSDMDTINKLIIRTKARYEDLTTQPERGDHMVAWVLGVIGAIAIAALVITALNGWFQTKLGQLN